MKVTKDLIVYPVHEYWLDIGKPESLEKAHMNGRNTYILHELYSINSCKRWIKRYSQKNIKPFNSKPLIYWSIKIALESNKVDRVIVSTEDEEIADIARSFSAEVPFMRPKKYSMDNSSGLEPIMHALETIPNINDLLILQPTSPLRRLEDIEGIFNQRSKFNSDSAVSLTLSKNLATFFN